MSAQTAIRRYDDFIMGKSPFYLQASAGKEDMRPTEDDGSEEARKRKALQKKRADMEKEKDALAIVRYIVKDLLGWTPVEALEHITTEKGRQYRMDVLLKYIDCPMEVRKLEDYQWVISRAFPAETKGRYDGTEQLLKLYGMVESGQLKKFPRNFFTGEDGIRKAAILFRNYVSKSIPVNSIEDLYRIFSDSAKGWKILRDAHLYYEVAPSYSLPIDFLHDSLSMSSEADDFVYSVYQYKAALQELRRQAGRQGETYGKEGGQHEKDS